MNKAELKKEIKKLEKKIRELKKGRAAHSEDPARLRKVEELEDRLETKKRKLKELNN